MIYDCRLREAEVGVGWAWGRIGWHLEIIQCGGFARARSARATREGITAGTAVSRSRKGEECRRQDLGGA